MKPMNITQLKLIKIGPQFEFAIPVAVGGIGEALNEVDTSGKGSDTDIGRGGSTEAAEENRVKGGQLRK